MIMPNTRQPGVHHCFADVLDTTAHAPLPDDWRRHHGCRRLNISDRLGPKLT